MYNVTTKVTLETQSEWNISANGRRVTLDLGDYRAIVTRLDFPVSEVPPRFEVEVYVCHSTEPGDTLQVDYISNVADLEAAKRHALSAIARHSGYRVRTSTEIVYT